jgi:hypothetical protein
MPIERAIELQPGPRPTEREHEDQGQTERRDEAE